MMRFILLLLLTTCLCLTDIHAQDTANAEEEVYTSEETENAPILVNPENTNNTLIYKTQSISKKEINPEDWSKVVGKTTFQEDAKKKVEGKIPQRSNTPWDGNMLRIISFTLIILLFVVLIYLIARNVQSENKKVKSKIIKPIYTEEIENIEEYETSNSLEQALAEGDYRLAIRIAFIDMLKSLHEKKQIVWKKDKTNTDYLYELGQHPHYVQLKSITRTYEIVWYGEQVPTKEDGEIIINRFRSIQQIIWQEIV